MYTKLVQLCLRVLNFTVNTYLETDETLEKVEDRIILIQLNMQPPDRLKLFGEFTLYITVLILSYTYSTVVHLFD